MTAAQLRVSGRPDEVRALIHAVRDGQPVRLHQEGPVRRLDGSTVAVHLTAVLDDDLQVRRAA